MTPKNLTLWPVRPMQSYVKAKVGSKQWANRKLRYAVFKGEIIKPDRCSECKELFPPGMIGGHHADYSKPFEVDWLCQSCHRLLHCRQESRKRNDKKGQEITHYRRKMALFQVLTEALKKASTIDMRG